MTFPFPADFPANCPPQQATRAGGPAYRFLSPGSATPSAVDFRQFRHEAPHRRIVPDLECQSCGVSINPIRQEALDLRAAVPGFRNRKLALGELTPAMGRTLPTPSPLAGQHHLTWWLHDGFDPSSAFALDAEEAA